MRRLKYYANIVPPKISIVTNTTLTIMVFLVRFSPWQIPLRDSVNSHSCQIPRHFQVWGFPDEWSLSYFRRSFGEGAGWVRSWPWLDRCCSTLVSVPDCSRQWPLTPCVVWPARRSRRPRRQCVWVVCRWVVGGGCRRSTWRAWVTAGDVARSRGPGRCPCALCWVGTGAVQSPDRRRRTSCRGNSSTSSWTAAGEALKYCLG